MATCTTTVCGTGGWNGPLPGDPDNSTVTLSAQATFGGINVRWSYPAVRPYAVAHVEIYRGTSANFATALQIGTQAGNVYFDEQNNTNTWYYWIRVVSVNGTYSDFIGPASAAARKRSSDIFDDIAGEIDRGWLSNDLNTAIDVIPFFESRLLAEIFDRETGQTSLAQAIQDANNGVAAAMTFIGTVNQSRITDNQALAETLTVTAATLQNGIAAVTSETRAEVIRLDGAITAEASQRNQVVSQLDDKYAGITDQQNTKITQNANGLAAEITAREQAVSNVGGRVTGVETNMTVVANQVNNIYTSAWTVKVEAGGLVGGFGLFNNSQTIEAGFRVDRFWIGAPGTTGSYPFVVDGGNVYIKKAIIKEADIDTLKIAGEAVTTINVANFGITNVPGDGSYSLIGSVTINTGTANPSAVMCRITMEANAASNCSAQFLLRHSAPGYNNDWTTAISLLGGFAQTHTIERAALAPGAGTQTFYVYARAMTSGAASNVPFQVSSAVLTIHGAKR